MRNFQRFAACLLVIAALCAGGCEIIGFIAGRGDAKALFTFDKNQRVLVVVDVRDTVVTPPAFSDGLGDKLATYLYHNLAADHIVSEDRLIALRDSDPVAYKKLGIADIARACNADVVLALDVYQFDVPISSDGTVGSGTGQLLVKVVNANGQRVWPTDPAGMPVNARIDPAFTSDRDKTAITEQLTDKLVEHTGRMFHSYSLEGSKMKRE